MASRSIAAGDQTQSCHEGGVPVARNHLGRDRLGHEAEAGGDDGFHPRVDIGEGADRPRQGAGGDLRARGLEPGAVPLKLGMMAGELEPESRGLGVDAVAAADAGRQPVLDGPAPEGGQEGIQIRQEQVGGLAKLERQRRIQEVRRGEAQMEVPGAGPAHFLDMREEGDDVVARGGLDGLDARRVDDCRAPRFGGAAQVGHLVGRNLAQLGHRLGCGKLDLEPQAELGLGRPDGAHLGPAVARDHGGSGGLAMMGTF